MSAKRQLLLLFDIDGTLLRGATEAQREALHGVLTDLFGVTGTAELEVPMAGRTDLEIARDVLRNAGVAEDRIDGQLAELELAWIERHTQLCGNDLTAHVIEGIAEALAQLSQTDNYRFSLVTGNLEPVARLKLRYAGIDSYFPIGQGAFGSDSEVRAELPPLARARAGTEAEPWPRADTVLIGDTPLDVACAHADEIYCIAVPTGPFVADELASADFVAERSEQLVKRLEELATSQR